MPFSRGRQYTRFNVGQYMRQKKLDNEAVKAKTKQVRATAAKLRRLDNKVKKNVC